MDKRQKIIETGEEEQVTTKETGIRKIIDGALVGVVVLLIVAAVSLMASSTFAISHIEPFNSCSTCILHK